VRAFYFRGGRTAAAGARNESESDRLARLETIKELTERVSAMSSGWRWLPGSVHKALATFSRALLEFGPGGNTVLRVVVDLTPLLPGGENGGAKPMTLELIRRMASSSPKTKFILLTLRRTFDELTAFKQPNVQVVVVDVSGIYQTHHYR